MLPASIADKSSPSCLAIISSSSCSRRLHLGRQSEGHEKADEDADGDEAEGKLRAFTAMQGIRVVSYS